MRSSSFLTTHCPPVRARSSATRLRSRRWPNGSRRGLRSHRHWLARVAVDAHVGHHIFTECIQKLLIKQGKRTVVMATHQLHTVSAMDSVTLLEEGGVVASGSPSVVAANAHALAQEIGENLVEVESPQRADGWSVGSCLSGSGGEGGDESPDSAVAVDEVAVAEKKADGDGPEADKTNTVMVAENKNGAQAAVCPAV